MLNRIRTFLAAPVFADEEKTRVARLLNITLLALLAAMVLLVVAIPLFSGLSLTSDEAFTLLSGLIVAITILGLWFLAQRGHLAVAGTVLLGLLWLLMTAWVWGVSGISSDSSTLVYGLIIVLASLLLGKYATIVFTVLGVLAVLVAYFLEAGHLLRVSDQPITLFDPLMAAIPLILTGLLLLHALSSLFATLERARKNEQAQLEANRELNALRASLEQRVSDRTRDLERRTIQLQTAAEVSRIITSILDTERLTWQVAELIQERFGLYHVGLFQLDPSGAWAEYRAGAGEGGRLLADQGFRLEVGGRSLVGWCTANAQARVVQDVTVETARIDHPLVPATRSEAALPLIARGQVIGALSVQSDQTGTFDPDIVATLQTIADQVAVALDNARLFAETQEALETTRRAYGQLSQQAWAELLQGRTDWGYQSIRQTVLPARGDWPAEMLQAVQTGQTVQGQEGDGPTWAIPIKVREETVGVLGLYTQAGDQAGTPSGSAGWTREKVQRLEEVVKQMGLALESARLFQDTRRLAARERTIRQITEQMRRAVDIEVILQNTLTELARTLGASRTYVRLGMKPGSPPAQNTEKRGGPATPLFPGAGGDEHHG
ncbi:MAG: GAF domain-containing protein [Anaerolineae bacterium]